MDGLTEGRMVHYVLPDDDSCQSPLEHRPAVVVKVWDKQAGTINLHVFTDFNNDYPDGDDGTIWATSVVYDEECAPGTWHWIEKA